MSVDVMTLVWKKAPYSGNTLLTLLALADWSDDYGKSWPAVEKLAKKSRQCERNCHSVLRTLQDEGFLKVVKRSGTSNMFQINLEKLEGMQSLHPAKTSKRGGLRVQSLPKKEEMFAPYTSIETPQDQKHTSGSLSLFENTESELKDSPGKKKNKKPAWRIPPNFPEWIPLDAWNGFMEMRSEKKNPNTDRAVNQLINLLRGLSEGNRETAGLILDRSTLKGWTDLYKLPEQNCQPKTQAAPESMIEAEKRREEEYKRRRRTGESYESEQ